jgi:hypothetical protein
MAMARSGGKLGRIVVSPYESNVMREDITKDNAIGLKGSSLFR